LIMSNGLERFAEMMREGAPVSYALIPMGLLVAAVSALFAGLGLPRPLAAVAVVMPWLCGITSARLSMSKVLAAVASVSPPDKSIMLAMGTSECLSSVVIGAALSAGVALGVTLSYLARLKRDGAAAL